MKLAADAKTPVAVSFPPSFNSDLEIESPASAGLFCCDDPARGRDAQAYRETRRKYPLRGAGPRPELAGVRLRAKLRFANACLTHVG